LPAGDARRREAATIAGTLVHGDVLDRLELRTQLGHGQLQRLASRIATDLDDMLVAVDAIGTAESLFQ
jgi:ribonucleotide reductase alpha subunit